MTDRWSKLAPLTGVLFAVLAVAAVVTNNRESPEAKAGPVKVVAYYTAHRSEVQTSAILFGLAFLVLVLFAGALRAYLRRTAAAEGLGALVLAGAILWRPARSRAPESNTGSPTTSTAWASRKPER